MIRWVEGGCLLQAVRLLEPEFDFAKEPHQHGLKFEVVG